MNVCDRAELEQQGLIGLLISIHASLCKSKVLPDSILIFYMSVSFKFHRVKW